MKVKFLLLALVVALVSCNKDDDEQQEPSGVKYLKVGNEWTYDLNVTTSGINMTGDFKYEVMEHMADGTYKVVETIVLEGIPDQTETYYWTEDDVFNIGHDMSDVSVGDTWEETEDGVTYTTTVISTGEDITVPAGTFSCIKLKLTQSDNDYESFSYYNQSYGLIFMESTMEEEEQGIVYTVEMEMKLKSKNF
jgi:hypothetical protein